jgi:hypothetical protein
MLRRSRRFIFWLIVLCEIIVNSCDYPSYSENANEEPHVAISSFFNTDSFFRVKIESVADAFSGKEGVFEIENVKIKNLVSKEVFVLKQQANAPRYFTSATLKPKPEEKFQIEIITNVSDKPVIANDSIPENPSLFRIVDTSVSIDPDGFGDAALIERTAVIKFLPVNDEKPNYYELAVYITNYPEKNQSIYGKEYQVDLVSSTSIITSEDYYPAKTSVESDKPSSLLFKCQSVVDSIIVDFSYESYPEFLKEGSTSSAHDLRIELRHVSYAYYKYKTTLYKQINAIKGDIIYGASPPVTVYSNVENGTGIFAGYIATSYSTFIKKYVYNQ